MSTSARETGKTPAQVAADGGRRLNVALAGNPNSGKTSLFNAVTGTRQKVGNYPGVTVERKAGVGTHGGRRLDVVDLPGTYSLTAYSIDELVARNYIIDEHPDVVIDVVDASNLERNLYLTVQLMELDVPLVVALNMSDVARRHGLSLDIETLSRLLGDVPIVPTVGSTGEGSKELLEAAVAVAEGRHRTRHVPISYGQEIDAEIECLAEMLDSCREAIAPRTPCWVALKLLEGDPGVRERISEDCPGAEEVLAEADRASDHLAGIFGDTPATLIADHRYGFISGACQEAVRSTIESRHEQSDKIDAVVTHPLLGLPIFLGLMFAVFYLTFNLGAYPKEWMEWLFEALQGGIGAIWPADTMGLLRSLVIDGMIGGVGGVIVFLPNILILFLGIALLEDSGYMARAAFIVDRWMHKIGLHGKSFIPMLIGFGCTVPAMMATRVLESRRDRLTTLLVLPLMSCSARLPIYVLFTGAFFPQVWRAPVMFALYIVGILLAVVLAKVARAWVLRGETTPFVMELPPYRRPTMKAALLHMWDRGRMYLRKAGTLILAASIVMWALMTFPRAPENAVENLSPSEAQAVALEHSVAGRIGRGLEPVTGPLGFDWRVNTAAIGAFAAKEVLVAQMGITYSMTGEDVEPETSENGAPEADRASPLQKKLRADYSPLQAVSVMLFMLIGLPCMATVAIMKAESGSWKWAALQWLALTGIAYAVSLGVYQVGTLVGLGG